MSDNLITSLHPKVIDAANKAITEAKARGFHVGIQSGLRFADEQERLYALGRTTINTDGLEITKPFGNIVTNARAYESWHSFGLAVDIVFKNEKGWTWSVSDDKWDSLGAVGEMYGLEWGGHWTKFPDFPHFQMRGKIPNIHEAKRILFEKGVDFLWAMV